MAKMVFDRIWKTFMIVVNSLWHLIVTVECFMALIDFRSFESEMEGLLVSTIIIGILNLVNWGTRRYLKNY